MIDRTVRKALWWVCLVIAPAVLVSIELFHPAGFTASPGMYKFLSEPMASDAHHGALAYPGPQWWFALHMIQTPMVGLVSVGLWLLVRDVRDADGTGPVMLAWISRTFTLVFLLYYTALDSIGGTGLGRLILNAQELAAAGRLTAEQISGVTNLLNVNWTDAWVGGVGSFISQTGSWAVFAAAASAGVALMLARKASWPVLLLLLAFGWELQTSHASPHGPLSFTFLIAASIRLWFEERRTRQSTHVRAGRTVTSSSGDDAGT